MKMKILVFLVLSVCAHAAEVKGKEDNAKLEPNKDKRQTRSEYVPENLIYRASRKQEAAPVVEPQDDDRDHVGRSDAEEYRPGQVFSLNPQELLDLQPERRAPLPSGQQLQQLYPSPQEHRQNLQQVYYLEPQSARQVSLQPSHAVIARPHYSANGGEASVGAALSVSDSGVSSSDAYSRDLLALLQAAPQPKEERERYQQPQPTQSIAPQYQQIASQNVAPQYQQVDRYITKPSKKPSKHRPKTHSHISPPQASAAPQQYLIETTNVQAQAPQPQPQPQYRPAQPQRVPQALRYVPVPSPQAFVQQALYERPESQGLKVVAPPNLQQARAQAPVTYRILPQYQQPIASPKQYRIVESPRPQPIRQEQRISASTIERPVTYYSRYQEPEKNRAVKIYDPVPQEAAGQQSSQIVGEKYYLRPVYRQNDQRTLYELGALAMRPVEPPQVEPSSPHSAIYVSKNVAPKKQPPREQAVLVERPASADHVKLEQHGQSLEEARNQLPPPRNNRAYTPDEFAALVAAGYAVTPIPVAPLAPAQARSSLEPAPAPPAPPAPLAHRRSYYRRHQYLPLRGDDAP